MQKATAAIRTEVSAPCGGRRRIFYKIPICSSQFYLFLSSTNNFVRGTADAHSGILFFAVSRVFTVPASQSLYESVWKRRLLIPYPQNKKLRLKVYL